MGGCENPNKPALVVRQVQDVAGIWSHFSPDVQETFVTNAGTFMEEVQERVLFIFQAPVGQAKLDSTECSARGTSSTNWLDDSTWVCRGP